MEEKIPIVDGKKSSLKIDDGSLTVDLILPVPPNFINLNTKNIPISVHAEPITESKEIDMGEYTFKISSYGSKSDEMFMQFVIEKRSKNGQNDGKSKKKKRNMFGCLKGSGSETDQQMEKIQRTIINIKLKFEIKNNDVEAPTLRVLENTESQEIQTDDNEGKSVFVVNLLRDPAIQGLMVAFAFSLLRRSGYECIQIF